jgi:hypothetical protein
MMALARWRHAKANGAARSSGGAVASQGEAAE